MKKLLVPVLLMSAMFRSFKDSLLVMLAIPLATFGGILALNLMKLKAPLFGILM